MRKIVAFMGVDTRSVRQVAAQFGYHRLKTYTTRKSRDGEVKGYDYYFITDQEFKERYIG